MRAVWKFPLGAYDADVVMAAGAKIVHVARQFPESRDEVVTVWAEVDTDARLTETRHFSVVGTGHPIAEGYWHAGSWLHGDFVWHLYEAKAADR